MLRKIGKIISSTFKGKKQIEKIYKGRTLVYEAFKKLLASGLFPLTLNKCKGVDLVDYKIYGESVQNGTPSPTNPVQIQSVGDRTKNLVNRKTLVIGSLNTDGQLHTLKYRITTDYIEVKPNTDYVASGKRIDGLILSTIICQYDENFNHIKRIVKNSITTEPNVKYVRVCFFNIAEGEDTTIEENIDLQLEEGSTPTEYEPYGYKIPVKVSGKNLFNINNLTSSTYVKNNNDGTITVSKYSANSGMTLQKLCPELKVGDSVRLSMETSGNRLIYLSNGINWNVGSMKTITQEMLDAKVYFYNNVDDKDTPVTISNIQIELGSVTAYEPYVEPVTTNIYLDEPLRKIGDYADYIDFENKTVVRNIYSEFIDTVNAKSSISGTYSIFLSDIDNKPFMVNELKGDAISSKFIQYTGNYSSLKLDGGYIQPYITSTGANRVAYTFNNTSINSVALAQEAIGDGFEVCYILDEPDPQTIELPNIPTIKGTTVLSVDTTIQPSNAEVKYMGKT